MDDFPPTNPPLPGDYSDVASAQSEEDPAEERRKHQRGGRKKNTTKNRMPPIPDSQNAPEPTHREGSKVDHEEPQVNGTSCPECAARKQKAEEQKAEEQKAEEQQAEEKTQPKPPTPFETGIRAFNMKRAASSGGRPVGVRTTSGSRKSKKKSSKKKKKAKAEVKESSTEEESSSEEDEDDEPQTKPMAIKLDLDLVIEIFLKAKIQGEVTITFLE